MRIFKSVSFLLLMLALMLIGMPLFSGCGRNSTDPIVTTRSPSEDDDTRLAYYAIETFDKFMLSIEQSKSRFGVNGGVDYSVYTPVGWDTLIPRDTTEQPTTEKLLSVPWSNLLYQSLYQESELSRIQFDKDLDAGIALRPARVFWGFYRYGALGISVRGIPDSIRERYRNLPFDGLDYEMKYSNNYRDPRFFSGQGAFTGVVNVNVTYAGGRANSNQSDTVTAKIEFDNVGYQIGDNSAHFKLSANLPYYNMLTDFYSFSRKPLEVEINVSQNGRGSGTIWYGGSERVHIYFEGRPYYYTGTFRIGLDNFAKSHTIPSTF